MILRLTLVVVVCVFAISSYFIARRKMDRALRLPLDFAISLYILTFGTGCVVMFVFQTEYLYYIFGNQQFLPSRTSYGTVLFVGLLPIFLVPWFVNLIEGGFRQPPGARVRTLIVSDAAMWTGSMVTLIVCLALLGTNAGLLLSNAVVGLQNTADLFQLYEQRRDTFNAITWLQGGIIYTTLPSIATMLLFWPGRKRGPTVAAGLLVFVLGLLFNIGTFQIGPTLASILSIAFCYACLAKGRIELRKIALPTMLGIAILAAYSIIKTTGYQVDPIQAYIMRLPAALPYLIQYASEQPGAVRASDFSLTFELARYMYPSLVQYSGWIATPQPAFVDAYFTFNPLVGLAVLLTVAAVIVLVGRTLASAWSSGQDGNPHTVMTAILATPVLYYIFQVDLISLFNSAFSALFALPPIIGTLLVNAAIPRQR